MKGEQKHDHCGSELGFDFAFAFDDPMFSDRILKLLIYDDVSDEKSKNRTSKDLIKSIQQRKEDIQESSKEVGVKCLNICSVVLAAKSPFFRKLFTNGMKACNQHEVTLRIYSSEEAPLVDVLKSIYNNNLLSADTPNALLEVLITADKFDVPSCVNYCCKLLLSFPMTVELALLYIDLSSIVSTDAIQPLRSAAKDFLPNILENIQRYREDIISLSLDGIKFIVSCDEFKVDSEDDIYDLLVDWSKKHFLDPEEQYRVLKTEVFEMIRLEHMSTQKLKNCFGDFYRDVPTPMVEAIVRDESKPCLLRHRRSYNLIPIAVMTFEIPVKQCVVFLDLKQKECKDITRTNSQTFILDESIFYLSVHRYKQETKDTTFGLFLNLKTRNKQSDVAVKFEFAVRKKSSPEKFETLKNAVNRTFTDDNEDFGFKDLFGTSWDTFMAEGSEFFLSGTLHLRIDVTIVNPLEVRTYG